MRLWDFGSSTTDFVMLSVAGGNVAAPVMFYEATKAGVKQQTSTAGNYAVTNTW
jgi:hypothetical protein